MKKRKVSFDTDDLVGYITTTEAKRKGFSLYAFTDGKNIYKKDDIKQL